MGAWDYDIFEALHEGDGSGLTIGNAGGAATPALPGDDGTHIGWARVQPRGKKLMQS